VKKDRRKLITS